MEYVNRYYEGTLYCSWKQLNKSDSWDMCCYLLVKLLVETVDTEGETGERGRDVDTLRGLVDDGVGMGIWVKLVDEERVVV